MSRRNPYRCCDGVTRRDMLRIGSLGIAGLALPDLLRLQPAAAATVSKTGAPKATSIIMIHLEGGPSQLDTYDPKPDSAVEIRGEFGAVDTNVAGVRFSEHFPLQAKLMDRLAVLRAVTCAKEEHSSSHLITGYWVQDRLIQGDKPSFGSTVSKLRGNGDPVVPNYLSFRQVTYDSGLAAAYLGPEYDPMPVTGPGMKDLSGGLALTPRRLEARGELLRKFDEMRRGIEESPVVAAQDAYTQRALSILSSSRTRDALDLKKESADVRERYGKDMQHFLAARRLIQAGVRSVALSIGGWDTHTGNFRELKKLLPRTDQAFSALMHDLINHGLYDSTLVVMWGEFGRTPKVNRDAGRDHWPRVMSAVVAGGGLRVGQVIGATDGTASQATDREVTPRDVLATLYTAIGIDPSTVFEDRQGRPVPLLHDGRVIPELLG